MNYGLWKIVQDVYDSSENKKYETLFTLANGYRGIRGNLEFSKIGERGNFIAGVFDKSSAQVTQIVNCQDPTVLNFYIDGKLIDIGSQELLEFKRELNMHEGILYTWITVRNNDGKITKIASERFVSRKNIHRWCAKYTISPVNYAGVISVESAIDGTTTNSTYSPAEISKHYRVVETINVNPGLGLRARTNDKGTEVIELTTLRFMEANRQVKSVDRKYGVFGEKAREIYTIHAAQGSEYGIIKYGVTYTSRDIDDDYPSKALHDLDNFLEQGYNIERIHHISVWEHLWELIDIKIHGDEAAQTGIRFNLFHLCASAYPGDGRISVAAKALHGEGYKGHVFWDTEIFMMPFFIYTNPEVAKQLLMYRYNTLDGARANARINGYKGAQFAWESADDGVEVTPKWGFDYDGNPVRIWTGDEEFHINSDIAFAIWEYYRASGDEEFLINYGVELFLDTAKFWCSRVEYNDRHDRYEINKVIGPDEFHEHVNNNVYTNYLAKWNLNKSVELALWLKGRSRINYEKLVNKLGLCEEDFMEWSRIQDKIYIPINEEDNIIEQFEGYFDLKYVPITEYDENGMPKWPELGNLKLGDTQLIKQPDVVMLMLVLADEFDRERKRKNYEYYENRTMHKSSLSPSMYSIMGLSVGDTQNAYRYFMKTVYTDLEDNQGNAEYGLHAASSGGAWQSAIFGFGGFSVDKEEIPNFNPWIPDLWEGMEYSLVWRGHVIHVNVGHRDIRFMSDGDIKIRVYDSIYELQTGKELKVTIPI